MKGIWMTAKIIDGKSIAAKFQNQIRGEIIVNQKQGVKPPKLAVILVGKDPASMIYVRNKHQACEEVGIESLNYSLPANITQEKLLQLIHKLNRDKKVNGILLQLPLPKHIKADEVLDHINPLKDVDGFHSVNIGKLAQYRPQLHPCTPLGIMLMLKSIGQSFKGKNAVIVGASNIVGKPMALELLAAGCTITICHRLTQDLDKKIKDAEILVSAVGKPGFIKGKWIKKGATVIDVGITMLPNGKVTGDVEFDKAKKNAKWITPVPGGVGPMTVTALLRNTVIAQEMQRNSNS
jgi:methylenetetrahydrofolate dehydrogenase (NADP+) / methenyltetrahydrofolate cyclohydrolase